MWHHQPAAHMRQLDGCDWWSQNDTDIAKAAELAAQSDIAIVAVGTRSIWLGRDAKSKKVTSGEGFDLSSLDLPGRQLDLLKAVKATGKPMIVVLITANVPAKRWCRFTSATTSARSTHLYSSSRRLRKSTLSRVRKRRWNSRFRSTSWHSTTNVCSASLSPENSRFRWELRRTTSSSVAPST